MNSNFSRTLLYLLSILALLGPVFFGCTSLPNGSFDCTMSWLPPQFAGIVAMGFMGLAVLIKAFGGEGLFTTGSTAFRSLLTFGGIIVTGVVVLLGCTNTGTAIDCSGSWIGPLWGGVIASILLGINLVIKKFDGTTLTKA